MNHTVLDPLELKEGDIILAPGPESELNTGPADKESDLKTSPEEKELDNSKTDPITDSDPSNHSWLKIAFGAGLGMVALVGLSCAVAGGPAIEQRGNAFGQAPGERANRGLPILPKTDERKYDIPEPTVAGPNVSGLATGP
eukprot:203473_1